jgi:DNA polymerase-3 subunit alpha
MQRVFADRFYVELQRHGEAREAKAEPGLVAWAYEHDVALVATNDVYYQTPDMHEAHDALMCIADGAFVGQDERRRVSGEHWFKTSAQMRALFADLPEACDNTLDIARRCAFMVKKRDPILPSFPTGAGRSEADELALPRASPSTAASPTKPSITSGWSARSASSKRWAFPATS